MFYVHVLKRELVFLELLLLLLLLSVLNLGTKFLVCYGLLKLFIYIFMKKLNFKIKRKLLLIDFEWSKYLRRTNTSNVRVVDN